MKTWVGILIGLFAASAFGGITEGSWEGTGKWQAKKGEKGEYKVTMTIKGTHIESHYDFAGEKMDFAFDVANVTNGFFDVHGKGGRKIGSGYCSSETWCHYSIPGKIRLEETVAFPESDATIYRLGSKYHYDHKTRKGDMVYWDETLKKVQ
jgi:hypothetical protein